ncbi:Glycine receptor subunit alphaZ1 [Holothuria leucospilota]|uniref:Glycine receptor subunit alphaZ1 n=1 Tax=Holothuria leucospilota TaxID=206669 RepID=A0A9Q1BMQ3_HOLLE|nr:Glycine receptor subunit alphaZ1 [Holothuria leucospilota]
MANVLQYCQLTIASVQLVVISVSVGLAVGQTFSKVERNIQAERETFHLFEELLYHYDKRIRPFFGTEYPVEVTVSVGIVSFESVSDVNLDFTVNTYLIQSWVDPRLRYNSSIHLPPTSHFVDNLWIPDLIFLNAKKAELHTVTTKNRVVEILSDGTVYLIQRLQLVIACAMDLRNFPMDQQRCPIDLESFEYTSEDLIFRFHRPPAFAFENSSKVPQFKVKGASCQNCSKPSAIGIISCIRLEFFFKRQVDYYFLHAYIPSFMLVTLSWLSFWIDVRSAPARVALGITTTLSMLTTSNGVRQDLPRFAYVKSIDIWFATNFSFVISALLEYALVHYIAVQRPTFKHLRASGTDGIQTNEDSQSEQAAHNGICLTRMVRSDFNDSNYSTSGQNVSKDQEEAEYLSKRKTQPISGDAIFRYGWGQKIDALCRVFFPATYFLFLLCYFLYSYEAYEIPEFSMEDLEDAFFNDTFGKNLSK